ncbi:MAG: hypothetical protein ACI945_000441 [Pseudohongiellaceae bacterium]|jgi:hypothetical protein
MKLRKAHSLKQAGAADKRDEVACLDNLALATAGY